MKYSLFQPNRNLFNPGIIQCGSNAIDSIHVIPKMDFATTTKETTANNPVKTFQRCMSIIFTAIPKMIKLQS
jgi:hypothetical protein